MGRLGGRIRWLMGIAAACTFASGLARAAGPYDGNWEGGAAGTASTRTQMTSCNATVTATIADNVVKGTVHWASANTPFSGTIAPDGSFKSSTGWITGKFAGRSFDGQFDLTNGHCNPYRVSLSRS